MKQVIFLLVAVGLMLSSAASAFIDPPELDPNPAIEGETVSLFLRMGECDGLNDLPMVTIEGLDIDVLLDGRRRFDPIFCNIPVGERTFPLGEFPAGEYTVTVRFRYTPLFSPPQIEILDVIQLVVEPMPHALPVPVWDRFGAFLLIVFVLVMGMIVSGKLTCWN